MLNIPRGITYMGIAVVAGLLAMFAIRSYVAHKTFIPPTATGQVAVATTDVSRAMLCPPPRSRSSPCRKNLSRPSAPPRCNRWRAGWP